MSFPRTHRKKRLLQLKRVKFKEEIVAIEIPQRKGDPVIFDTDEYVRAAQLQKN